MMMMMMMLTMTMKMTMVEDYNIDINNDLPCPSDESAVSTCGMYPGSFVSEHYLEGFSRWAGSSRINCPERFTQQWLAVHYINFLLRSPSDEAIGVAVLASTYVKRTTVHVVQTFAWGGHYNLSCKRSSCRSMRHR